MVIIPATISNNVPGTDLSLGADTALNVIVEVRKCYKASVPYTVLHRRGLVHGTILGFVNGVLLLSKHERQ